MPGTCSSNEHLPPTSRSPKDWSLSRIISTSNDVFPRPWPCWPCPMLWLLRTWLGGSPVAPGFNGNGRRVVDAHMVMPNNACSSGHNPATLGGTGAADDADDDAKTAAAAAAVAVAAAEEEAAKRGNVSPGFLRRIGPTSCMRCLINCRDSCDGVRRVCGRGEEGGGGGRQWGRAEG